MSEQLAEGMSLLINECRMYKCRMYKCRMYSHDIPASVGVREQSAANTYARLTAVTSLNFHLEGVF
jgi:hypothetical protein